MIETLPNRQHLQTLAENRKGKPSANRGKKFAIEVLTPDEIKQLLRGCNPKCPTGARNRALLALMYRAMLRVSEALSLLPKDVDLKKGQINIRRGKGCKQRIVGLDEGACALLQLWMTQRTQLGLTPQTPIFVTLKGKQVSRYYVRNLLNRLGKKAGLAKRVHPHSMRHSGASELVGEGFDLVTISKQLGHANVATTSRYVSHLCPHQLVAAMHNRSWEV